MGVGTVEPVPLRDLWPNEASGLATWLGENLVLLGKTLGKELSFLEQEASAGTFSADSLAEDANTRAVGTEGDLICLSTSSTRQADLQLVS
jgi:hypothetical protein